MHMWAHKQEKKKKKLDNLNYNFNISLNNAEVKTSLKIVCVLWKKLKFIFVWFTWNMKTAKPVRRFPGTAPVFILVYIFDSVIPFFNSYLCFLVFLETV